MATARADIPQAFAGLLERYRYKVYHGGRGFGKSWTFATVLITRAAEWPLRILCTRETMTSIRESVHQLLCDRIHALGLANQFVIDRAWQCDGACWGGRLGGAGGSPGQRKWGGPWGPPQFVGFISLSEDIEQIVPGAQVVLVWGVQSVRGVYPSLDQARGAR
jgi:hypothetical protein